MSRGYNNQLRQKSHSETEQFLNERSESHVEDPELAHFVPHHTERQSTPRRYGILRGTGFTVIGCLFLYIASTLIALQLLRLGITILLHRLLDAAGAFAVAI
jgi:hypothetical protein